MVVDFPTMHFGGCNCGCHLYQMPNPVFDFFRPKELSAQDIDRVAYRVAEILAERLKPLEEAKREVGVGARDASCVTPAPVVVPPVVVPPVVEVAAEE